MRCNCCMPPARDASLERQQSVSWLVGNAGMLTNSVSTAVGHSSICHCYFITLFVVFVSVCKLKICYISYCTSCCHCHTVDFLGYCTRKCWLASAALCVMRVTMRGRRVLVYAPVCVWFTSSLPPKATNQPINWPQY